MSIGIGLGGFMDGFQRGQQIKQRGEEIKRTKVLQDRQDVEYNRGIQQRDEIDTINKSAQAEFDNRVAAGTEKPDNFDQFWTGYTLPRLKNTYLRNGDVETAKRFQEWGDSEDAKTGGKLAMGALLKAQTGDAEGALADVIKAGQIKGYINHGYEVLGHEQIVSPEGKPTGYRINLKMPDGKQVAQDIATPDLPRMIATFLNPEAAWQSQQAAREQSGKDARELKMHEEKKKIDKEYGTAGDKGRAKAITAIRKRMDGGIDGSETKFDDLPREQQEKLIGAEIELLTGQPGLAGTPAPAAAPAKKVIVDTSTGKPVQPKTPPSQSEKKERPAASGKSGSDEKATALAKAEASIKNGERLYDVAMELQESGIPESEWPAPVKQALEKQRAAIGLGR